jgi:hypothetical protein
VNIGDILRVYTQLVTPPKEKIALYVGSHFGNELFFWFNTNPRKRPGQIAVARGEAPGITRDCFLDCGQVRTFTAYELAAAQHCGRATRDFCRRVADEVAWRATTLTKGQRSSIAWALNSWSP